MCNVYVYISIVVLFCYIPFEDHIFVLSLLGADALWGPIGDAWGAALGAVAAAQLFSPRRYNSKANINHVWGPFVTNKVYCLILVAIGTDLLI